MWKKALLIIAVLVGLLLGGAALAGLTPAYLISAPGVATGIGAKLLCSARFVSGFSEEQAFDDLVQYSPILQYLDIRYTENRVHTSLFGLSATEASYLPGIGCAIEYDGHATRHSLRSRQLPELASEWPHGSRVSHIDTDVQEQLEQLVQQDNDAGLNTRALLAVRDGRIIGEAYDQGADARTPLLGWSMAKSLTSVMLGNLALRGKLDPQAAPGFARWARDDRAGIRISHLLTMTDGLDFSEEYNPGDDATAMLFTEPSASDYVLARPLAHEPGSIFNYSSGTANILSRLHSERTGGHIQVSYDDYLRHIAAPLGFQHSVFETDASGVFVGSSYLYASARDWARLGQMMLNEGVLNGYRIVSRDWVAKSIEPNQSQNSRAYGYQWWLNAGDAELRWPDLPAGSFAAQGNRQQTLMIIPSENMVIVRLGWTSGSYPVNARFAEIVLSAR